MKRWVKKGDIYYPRLNPIKSKIAFVEKDFSPEKFTLEIISINSKKRIKVALIDSIFPTFAWKNKTDRLYYNKIINGVSRLFYWDNNIKKSRLVKKLDRISPFYYYIYHHILSQCCVF